MFLIGRKQWRVLSVKKRKKKEEGEGGGQEEEQVQEREQEQEGFGGREKGKQAPAFSLVLHAGLI